MVLGIWMFFWNKGLFFFEIREVEVIGREGVVYSDDRFCRMYSFVGVFLWR